jgi:Spy/CpxP family protein refolding chaperone
MVAAAECGGNAAKGKGKNMKSLMMTVVAALACAAFAQAPEGGAPREGGRRGGMGPGMMGGGAMMDPIVRMVSNPKAAEKLGLSEEQQAKLKEINKIDEAGRERQKKVREAMMKQLDLMKADKVDEAAVMKAIDEVFELRKEMAKDQAKRVIVVKSILTPEQIAKAHEEMKKMSAARGDRGARRGTGPREGRGPRGGDKPGPKPEAPAPKPEAE